MGVSYHGGFDLQIREETLKCLVIINIYSFISWFFPPIFCPFKKSGYLNDNDGVKDQHIPLGDGTLDLELLKKVKRGIIELNDFDNVLKSKKVIEKYI